MRYWTTPELEIRRPCDSQSPEQFYPVPHEKLRAGRVYYVGACVSLRFFFRVAVIFFRFILWVKLLCDVVDESHTSLLRIIHE